MRVSIGSPVGVVEHRCSGREGCRDQRRLPAEVTRNRVHTGPLSGPDATALVGGVHHAVYRRAATDVIT
jgi:hypothetical protein